MVLLPLLGLTLLFGIIPGVILIDLHPSVTHLLYTFPNTYTTTVQSYTTDSPPGVILIDHTSPTVLLIVQITTDLSNLADSPQLIFLVFFCSGVILIDHTSSLMFLIVLIVLLPGVILIDHTSPTVH